LRTGGVATHVHWTLALLDRRWSPQIIVMVIYVGNPAQKEFLVEV